MASRLSRHDSYGRPLPRLTDAPRQDLTASATNVEQRERLLRRLVTTMEEHYPYLLRRDVSAEVTITFKVVHGTIQEDLYVGIVRHYRQEEE
jgi:hypothetical protein